MISIIIPVYNAAKKLHRCVDSVLKQTYSDIELLLIDDGSTDGSSEICLEYVKKDNRVRYIYKPNGGAASARNQGIKEAKGEYIQFVDSDDYISSDMTAMLHESIVNYCSDLSICGMVSYTLTSSNSIIYEDTLGLSINDFKHYVYKYYKTGILHSCCNKLYKRALIKSEMNPLYRWGEDYIFNLEYLLNVKTVSIVKQALYYYDCTTESVTRSRYEKQEIYIKERYAISFEYLNKIFQSQDINHIISYHYMCELFEDYKYTNNFLQINKKTIKLILDENSEVINFIKPTDVVSNFIIQRKASNISRKLQKEKLIFLFKKTIKTIVKWVIKKE